MKQLEKLGFALYISFVVLLAGVAMYLATTLILEGILGEDIEKCYIQPKLRKALNLKPIERHYSCNN